MEPSNEPAVGRLNIAESAIDRHVAAGRGDTVALGWITRSGDRIDLDYADLQRATSRFAGVLDRLGLARGEAVATLLGREPNLHIAALGTLRFGGVYCPLFSVFGPDPVVERLALGRVRVLVTTALQYRRKLADRRLQVPGLRHVLLVDGGAAEFDDPTVLDLAPLLLVCPDHRPAADTRPDDPALLHFTSGTTGPPKGALHVHQAVIGHERSAREVLDLRPDDVFWCTADPGWVTGTSYGIIAPLAVGATSLVVESDFDVERWRRTVVDHHVDVLYTAPTALRMLRAAGGRARLTTRDSALRLVASVGEPLDGALVDWGVDAFGVPVLDTWWQTETGSIMIANRLGTEIRPGSMGRPVTGITATVLRCDADGTRLADSTGHAVEVTEADEVGELALLAGWPSMFRGYLDDDDRYRRSFAGHWYCTGDLVRRDADGRFWFVGRADDLVKTAGHLVGPFEVETAMNAHEAVRESGVIGVPDPTAGAIVKAFVVLVDPAAASDELRLELLAHGRDRLGTAIAPREVEFVATLPHTTSGKILRRTLRDAPPEPVRPTAESAGALVLEVIGSVAPERRAELAGLDPRVDLWEALQLDSMDHLEVMTALWERTGVEIAERDYPRLRSLDALARHLGAATGSG